MYLCGLTVKLFTVFQKKQQKKKYFEEIIILFI